VRSFTRGLGVALFSLGLLGVIGCGTENEGEAARLAKTAGDPGAPNPKAKADDLPPPKTQEEQAQRQLDAQNKMYKAGAYPGSKQK